MNKKDLEERLIGFAVIIIEIAETMTETKASNHLAGQLLSAGTSPALNYAEAQSGESLRNFIHFRFEDKIILALRDCNELISIFVKSVETAQKNIQSKTA